MEIIFALPFSTLYKSDKYTSYASENMKAMPSL